MKKQRSQNGCAICKARRLKCDEANPVCGQCAKRYRACKWKVSSIRHKAHQPAKPLTGSVNRLEEVAPGKSHGTESLLEPVKGASCSDVDSELSAAQCAAAPSPVMQVSTMNTACPTAQYSQEPLPFTHAEALLVHHYIEKLSRWLDCTDGLRHFALNIPGEAKHSPILRYAILSFAARHQKNDDAAQYAYQQFIALLVPRLNESPTTHSDTLLCAIVISHFCEKLYVPPGFVSNSQYHLAGCAAILRTSRGHRFVDPSSPTLREAAFWVYVRQCLYDSTIRQEPPEIDFSLRLQPDVASIQDSPSVGWRRVETAWANQAIWNAACVANCSFGGPPPYDQAGDKNYRSQKLWDAIQLWQRDKPTRFDPIWQSDAQNMTTSADIWFIEDCHAVAYGFYHLSCLLLLAYKPGPKFAFRSGNSLVADTDRRILEHARAIRNACRSAPGIVPLSILLCHTVFIWGPLLRDRQEREDVLVILASFEDIHSWSTAWIVEALKREWRLE